MKSADEQARALARSLKDSFPSASVEEILDFKKTQREGVLVHLRRAEVEARLSHAPEAYEQVDFLRRNDVSIGLQIEALEKSRRI